MHDPIGASMTKIVNHLYIFLTIIFTVYSQHIMRWQVSLAGDLPNSLSGKIDFLKALLLNPWIVTSLLSTFLAGISWILAMTRFEISYAFPFVSLNYVLILVASVIVFNESFTVTKLVGSIIIVIGIVVIAKG